MGKETEIKFSEIPLPSGKLMLVDLDKTLIDSNYQITNQGIFDEITRVQSLGWQIGLSSDTPLESLKVWRGRFGMNGPILAERGAVIWSPGKPEIVINPEAEQFFTSLRLALIQQLAFNRINFFHGDVTQFIRNKPVLNEMVDPRLILIQAYRRCSLNFYGKKILPDGALDIDNNLTKQTVELTNRLMETPPFEVEEDYNPDYGICIFSPKQMTKRLGTIRLLTDLDLKKVGIIGDSTTDIVGIDIAFHYAVGNAKPEFKNNSVFVAQNSYTSGVIEILKLIKNRK